MAEQNIGLNARVYGNAHMYAHAVVSGNAHICGSAVISGDGWVGGSDRVGCDDSEPDGGELPEENVISKDVN